MSNNSNKYKQKNLPIEEIIDLYQNQYWTIPEISNYFKVNYQTIKLRLQKNNVTLRDKKTEKEMVMNRDDVKEKVSKGSKNSEEKRKQTNLERYGHETAMDAPQIKEKWQKEHERKYGVKYGTQRKDTIEKRKQTNLERYGVDNTAKVDFVREKISLNRWQNKSVEELQKIKEKSKFNSITELIRIEKLKQNRWQNKSDEELEEIKNKTKQTWLEKYGVDNPNKRQESKENLSKIHTQKFLEEQLPYILDYLNVDLLDSWNGASNNYNFKCRKCGTCFNRNYVDLYLQRTDCPTCRDYGSKGENEIYKFLNEELNIQNIIRNSRNIIYPKELDIYIPDKNIAIEFNGLYWHREDNHNFDKFYHLNKTLECENKGIQLIHIFEDEWIFKQNIVKERLKQILKVNDSVKINARECEIMEIDAKTKNQFLEQFHLQGKDASIVKLGAFYNGKLISVITFRYGNISKGSKPKENVWELNRFCSDYNYHIPGIASRFLTYFQRNYKWNEIFSYADRRWSIGNLYKQIGFSHIYNTNPNYWYIKYYYRIHRFNLRKTEKDQKNIPEWKLRLDEGYYRVWDCGNLKFELKG